MALESYIDPADSYAGSLDMESSVTEEEFLGFLDYFGLGEEEIEKLLEEFLDSLEGEEEPGGKSPYPAEDADEEDGEEKYSSLFRKKFMRYLLARFGEEREEIAEAYTEDPGGRAGYERGVSYEGGDEGVNLESSPGVNKVNYTDPVFFNKQWTYQRVFVEGEGGERTVYELTAGKMRKSGMDVETRHDEKFGTEYVTSIDGTKDGQKDPQTGKRMYWEYWIVDKDTGEERIGEESVYKQKVKQNEAVEWRLATEQEHGCGGGGMSAEMLANDPAVNKSLLPMYVQRAISMKRETYSSGRGGIGSGYRSGTGL